MKPGEPGPRARTLTARRALLEADRLETWLGRGRQRLHPENLPSLGGLLSLGLKALGLKRRGVANALSPRLLVRELAVNGLPSAFDGLRLLFMSDLHIDGLAGLTEAVLALIGGLEYDLCLLGGDYRFLTRGPLRASRRQMARLLAGLTPGLATVGILGNHDFAEEADWLRGRGVIMLVNQALRLERGGGELWLAGVDDPHYYGADDLAGALADAPPGACKVLLAHSPELYAEAAAAGVGLYLCGHTHAGQIRLPGLGAPVVNANCARRYCAGLWSHGAMIGYTSPGLGATMVPVRYHCPPEAALFTLRRPA